MENALYMKSEQKQTQEKHHKVKLLRMVDLKIVWNFYVGFRPIM
jgi:hypothetical protein